MTYGTIIPWLQIDGQDAPYPVLNERAIRATAGIMMVIGIITFYLVSTTKNYALMYVIVPWFRIEFFIRTVRWPQRSPLAMLGRRIVRNQKPERVGAIQKRFAWWLGLAMATAMVIVALILQIRWIAPFAICMTCLFFMRMESALGICVGCKIYYGLIHLGRIKAPDVKPACPGGACPMPGIGKNSLS